MVTFRWYVYKLGSVVTKHSHTSLLYLKPKLTPDSKEACKMVGGITYQPREKLHAKHIETSKADDLVKTACTLRGGRFRRTNWASNFQH